MMTAAMTSVVVKTVDVIAKAVVCFRWQSPELENVGLRMLWNGTKFQRDVACRT